MQDFSDIDLSQLDVATQFMIGQGGGLDKFMNSWVGKFRKKYTSLIDETVFSDLYADNPDLKPDVPIRWLAASLILMSKKKMDYKSLEDSLTYDITSRFAIGSESVAGLPFRMEDLRDFEQKLRNYKDETGIDLIKKSLK